MAGQGWSKNKKGFMVNADGKTARQVRAEKRSAAKASGGGGGGGGGGDNFDNYSKEQLKGMLAESESVMRKLDKLTKSPKPKAKPASAKPQSEDNFDNYSKEQLKGMLAESESVMKKLDKLTKSPKTKAKSASAKPQKRRALPPAQQPTNKKNPD